MLGPGILNNLLLPDFFAMALLVCVLLAVRGNQERASMRLWIAGLMLILLECASRIIYTVHTGLLVHRLTHALALDCYFVAGAMFVRSASSAIQKMRRSTLFFYLNVAPFVALLTVYGFDNRSAWTYRALVVAGLGIGLTSSAFFKRRWYFYGAFLLIWTPVLICSSIQQFRSAIYFSLAFLYILAGVAFYGFLPAGSRGKIAIVAGFSMWSLCFLTHPWIAAAHPSWGPFANEVWNMQKFIITVGLLLSLLERQVRSNEWLALHDELTSLPNRRLFDDRLQHALFRAERDGQRVAIFNIDLDGFKNINDTLGHHAGDLLLRGVAQHLLGATRRTDTLARLGGDEFSLIAVDPGHGPRPHRGVEAPAPSAADPAHLHVAAARCGAAGTAGRWLWRCHGRGLRQHWRRRIS